MTPFKCKHCGATLINHGHDCNKEDSVHIVQIVNGGGSWGRSNLGAGRELFKSTIG